MMAPEIVFSIVFLVPFIACAVIFIFVVERQYVRFLKEMPQLLADPEPRIRKRALKRLRWLLIWKPEEPLFTSLFQAATDPDWRLRRTVANGLRRELKRSIPPSRQLFQPIGIHASEITRVLFSLIADTHVAVRKTSIKALRALQQHQRLRKAVFDRLGQFGIMPLLSALTHPDPAVRFEAATFLGYAQATSPIVPLLARLNDPTPRVKHAVRQSLQQVCQQIETVIVGNVEPRDPQHTVSNLTWSEVPDGMPNLQTVILEADSCPPHQDDALARYILQHVAHTSLKKRGTIIIRGNPTKLSHTFYEMCNHIKEVDIAIECVRFGRSFSMMSHSSPILMNPDVSDFRLALNRLTRIEIETETYNFHLIEHFLTYAVNYLGQKYLKEHVVVFIFGEPKKLHVNLRNSLTNLCRQVIIADVQESSFEMQGEKKNIGWVSREDD